MYSYRIEQAIRAAALLHEGQKRRGKVPLPYVTHLAAVAWIVSDYTNSEDAIVSAWLHDTLEDTDYTTEELEDDKKLTWAESKEAYNEQLKTGPDEALILAAADKIHNMRSIVEEYHGNHKAFLKDFPGDLNERALRYQNLSNILNRRLTNDIIAEFNHVYTEYKNFLSHVKKNSEVRI